MLKKIIFTRIYSVYVESKKAKKTVFFKGKSESFIKKTV